MHEILLKAAMIPLRFMEVYTLIHVPPLPAVGCAAMILRGVGGAAKHRFSYLEKRAKKGWKEPQRKSLISSGGMRAASKVSVLYHSSFTGLTKHDKLM